MNSSHETKLGRFIQKYIEEYQNNYQAEVHFLKDHDIQFDVPNSVRSGNRSTTMFGAVARSVAADMQLSSMYLTSTGRFCKFPRPDCKIYDSSNSTQIYVHSERLLESREGYTSFKVTISKQPSI